MATDGDLSLIKATVLAALAPDVPQIYLIGSHARQTAQPSSDIDVMICAATALSLARLSVLRELFEESALPYHVDLVDFRRLDSATQEKMVQETVLL